MKNKVVVITGAGGVLCSEIAKFYALNGAKVALLDINENAMKAVIDNITESVNLAEKSAEKEAKNGKKTAKNDTFSPLNLKAYIANVLEKESLEAAYKMIEKDFGTPDILINGAGGNNPKATTDDEFFDIKNEGIKDFFALDKAGVDFVFNLNFLGTFLTTQVFAKSMAQRGDGCILNISSMNAFTPLTKIPAYSGAKAAVSNFTQWLAVYFAKSGLRVNAIAPGFFATNQNRTLLFNPDGSLTPRSNKILTNTPMGRFGDPAELLGAVDFLTDDKKSGFITGIVLAIDGGFSAYSGV